MAKKQTNYQLDVLTKQQVNISLVGMMVIAIGAASILLGTSMAALGVSTAPSFKIATAPNPNFFVTFQTPTCFTKQFVFLPSSEIGSSYVNASDLTNYIPRLQVVSKRNEAGGYDDYIVGLPFTDFKLETGEGYLFGIDRCRKSALLSLPGYQRGGEVLNINWIEDRSPTQNEFLLPNSWEGKTMQDLCNDLGESVGKVTAYNYKNRKINDYICGSDTDDFGIDTRSAVIIHKKEFDSFWNNLGEGRKTYTVTLLKTPTTSLNAEDLLQGLRPYDCDRVVRYKTDTGMNDTHIINLPFNNYEINVGQGYYVKCNSQPDLNILPGTPITSQINVNLVSGYNFIGVPYTENAVSSDNIAASSLVDSVGVWDIKSQDWDFENSFTVKSKMAFIIKANAEAVYGCGGGICAPSTGPKCTLFQTRLEAAWNTSCGDENYDAGVDISGPNDISDGTVDYNDLFDYSFNAYDEDWCDTKMSQTNYVCDAGPVCNTFLSYLLNSWNTSCGDENYDYRVDISGPNDIPDGTVDYQDLFDYSFNAYDESWCQDKLSTQNYICDVGPYCNNFLSYLNIAWNTSCGDEDYYSRVDVSGLDGLPDGTVDYQDLFDYSFNAYDEDWCNDQLSATTNVCL